MPAQISLPKTELLILGRASWEARRAKENAMYFIFLLSSLYEKSYRTLFWGGTLEDLTARVCCRYRQE